MRVIGFCTTLSCLERRDQIPRSALDSSSELHSVNPDRRAQSMELASKSGEILKLGRPGVAVVHSYRFEGIVRESLYFCFVLLRIKCAVMIPNPEIGFRHLLVLWGLNVL